MVPDLRASAKVLLSALPLWSPLTGADELEAIRRQMETLDTAYNRLETLEKRLRNAEARTETLQRGRSQAASSSAARSFNPDLRVILHGSLNSYSANPDSYAMPGVQVGEAAGLAPQGLTPAQSIFDRA
jgi:uncharacterized membrane protein YccC